MTDLVDSTRHAREVGDAAMRELWITHDNTARDLLQVWRGIEIEKTDGLVAVFADAADATGYALAYHRELALQRFPLRARAAIHQGPLSFRESSEAHAALGAKRFEADGLVKPVTARLLDLASGAQTLLTSDALPSARVASGQTRSHGHWQLKGLAEPVEVFEVKAEGGSFGTLGDRDKAFRVVRLRDLWLPAREIRHGLPAERDAFVGRRAAIAALAGKFARGARLVSVVGIGGAGKTRLALRFAWQSLAEYPGGAWFCDLTQAQSLDGICFAVAQGLGMPLTESDPALQLARAIAGRGRCLLIVDNFEQVSAHAESVLGRWLEMAPEATFLVTTRETLGIAGEETLWLSSMPPDDGVELFMRRARSARDDYTPQAGDSDAISELVRGLDGLPLAIELAAARVRVLPPRLLLAKLHERFQWLWSRNGRRDRQSTLRAAFDWSWDLLNGIEKSAAARLSVFDGGFDIAAAQALLSEFSTRTLGVHEMVESLLSKSFVMQAGDGRYDLLESVRQYADDHLRAEGRFEGSGPALAARVLRLHWQHYGSLLDGEAVAADANNLVIACRRATAACDAEAAGHCLRAAWFVLRVTGPFGVGAELAMGMLALPNLEGGPRASGHWVAAGAWELLGEVDLVRGHLRDGLACIGQGTDVIDEARLLVALGIRQTIDGDGQAAHTLRMAADKAAASADLRLQALACINLGKLMDHQGRLGDARASYAHALNLSRQAGDRRLEGGVLGNLGGLHLDLGEFSEAQKLYETSLTIADEMGDLRWKGNAECNLGLLCADRGHLADARRHLERAGDIARQIGHSTLEYTVLCNLGIVADASGMPEEAIEHFGLAVAAAHRAADRRAEGQFTGYLAAVLARQGALIEARECLRRAEGLLLDMSDRLSHALLMCQRAELELSAGQPADAGRALAHARTIAAEMAAGPESELVRKLAKLDAALVSR